MPLRELVGAARIFRVDESERYEERCARDRLDRVMQVSVSAGWHGQYFPPNYDPMLLLGRTQLSNILPGHNIVGRRGQNFGFSSGSTPEDMWGSAIFGGGDYVFPSAEVNVEVVCVDAADSIAGVGVRQVLIDGLDINLTPRFEVVETNGVTPVTAVQTYFRINNMVAIQCGTALENVGDIACREAGGGNVLAAMPTGWGQASHGIYTVPKGEVVFLSTVQIGVLPLIQGNLLTCVTFRDSQTPDFPWVQDLFTPINAAGTSTYSAQTGAYLAFPEGLDIKVRILEANMANMQAVVVAQFISLDSNLIINQ